MRWVLAAVIVGHGVIHTMGFAKAFGLAALPALGQPISRAMGVLWLLAALCMIASGVLSVAAPRRWWWLGAIAVVVSQIVIASSWSDARFGTMANVLVLLAVVHGALTWGPSSFAVRYEREARPRLAVARSLPSSPITEAELDPLPAPVQRFLRRVGVVGQPHVHGYHARWRGRIRSGASSPWMPLVADQTSFTAPAARLFQMRATLFGVPIAGLHRYVGDAATMNVRALSLVSVADASGPELTRAETVTLLNDMCVIAPGTLVDPALRWTPIDDRRARVSMTNAGHTVGAELVFDEAGDLVDFVSDDRAQWIDGQPRALRWSTPLREHRSFGALRLPARGEARWHAPDGSFTYIELELLEASTSPDDAHAA